MVKDWRSLGFSVLLMAGCGQGEMPAPETRSISTSTETAGQTSSNEKTVEPVQVEMKNVNFHVDDSIVLRIRALRGFMVSRKPGTPPTFDDKNSYILTINSGEIAIGSDSLTDLMNRYVLRATGSPLKNVEVTIDGQQVRQTGTIRKGIDIPFALVADVGMTKDGSLQLHPDKLNMVGIPAQGIMHFFGLQMDDVVKPDATKGLKVQGDDLILDPTELMPAPALRGRLIAVRLEPDALVEVFGGADDSHTLSPPISAANYMYYRGGTLRFGKMIMTDTDMQIIDQDPTDPFDFYPDRYNEQLVAGYSKSTPALGLEVFMPDYDHLVKQARARKP